MEAALDIIDISDSDGDEDLTGAQSDLQHGYSDIVHITCCIKV